MVSLFEYLRLSGGGQEHDTENPSRRPQNSAPRTGPL